MKRVSFLALGILTLSSLPSFAGGPSKITGWISDSMCGAKHAGTGAACVKKCVEGGMSPVFVDEAKKSVWTIDNPDAVKAFYGDKVTITASADDAKKSVHIDAIAAAK